MSTKNKTYTAADIHRFTDTDGRSFAHVPWDLITGEIPDNVIYPTTWSREAFDGEGWRDWDTYPTVDEEPFALIPADRIEVVTEHVEATVMDALQALVESGGKPVEGWGFDDDPSDGLHHVGTIQGVDAEEKTSHPFMAGIGHDYEWYRFAFRPVIRVRIKAEPKFKPKFKVGDLVEVAREATSIRGRIVEVKNAKRSTADLICYVFVPAGQADTESFAVFESELRPWKPGYGFTTDGDPVPPPPEGWEIVPEGEEIGEGAKVLSVLSGWRDSDGSVHRAWHGHNIRAYARRVVKELSTAETVEQAFSKYWQSGSEHRAIDAFRAGAAWAKEAQR